MEVRRSDIDGLIEFIPIVFSDDRGYFFETFREDFFKDIGIKEDFVQDNQSFSKKGTLRGLHFQLPPFAQGKLVRVIQGKVLDVAVDLRPDSPTLGQHRKFILDAQSHNMLYVPEGFAHGFVALEDSVFVYKCTSVYDSASERGIIYNDQSLSIDWVVTDPLLSDKDMMLPSYQDAIK